MRQDTSEPVFGDEEFFGQTTVHPVGLTALIVLGVMTIVLPRRLAIFPTLILVCFIPSAQRIVLVDLDFTFLRIMAMCGMVRIVIHGELKGVRWERADAIVLAWAFSEVLFYTLRTGSGSQFFLIAGRAFDALSLYFMLRCLVRSWRDLDNLAIALTLIAFPLTVAFIIEKSTGRNVFSLFGGVPELTIVRDDKLRCQGAYPHPILAGCFWAAMLPLVTARLWQRAVGAKLVAAAATVGVGVIIFACASSTPIASVMAGCCAAAGIVVRNYLAWIRRGIVVTLIGLHMVMNAPVWHLISRLDFTGGSTGWHRFHLVDQAIRRFGEWAVMGVDSTAHWGWGLEDVTNQYVAEGVTGGFLTLVLFVAIFVVAYSRVGILWRAAGRNRAKLALAWALGVSLFVHMTSFIAVSYFGQVIFSWYLTVAVIVSMAEVELGRARAEARAREREREPARGERGAVPVSTPSS